MWSGQDNNCNSYVFAGVLDDNRHVVIDPGHVTTPALREPGLESLCERMEEDGIDPAAIGLVLLTHCHPDHTEAAGAIREKTRALVAIHEAGVQAMVCFECRYSAHFRMVRSILDQGLVGELHYAEVGFDVFDAVMRPVPIPGPVPA